MLWVAQAAQSDREVGMPSEWHSVGVCWMRAGHGGTGCEGRSEAPTPARSASTPHTGVQESPSKDALIIGMLPLPTLSGGVQRWNR